ncbi:MULTISPECIES: hypothetical protein [Burkholderia]|uniref:hypothetical protein n=1 Tax=Burkholderia TaxID=32008 RepID=UPI000F5AC526|nr:MULTISPECIES: hypothetical protein [Burkholderia]
MNNSYRASRGSRICLLVLTTPGIALFLFAGFGIIKRENLLVALVFFLMAALLAAWLTFMLTMRVDLTEQTIVRSWLLGYKAVPISQITSLRWSGARGQTILSVAYGKPRRFILLSSIIVPTAKLLEIQNDILALRGLAGETLWPPMSTDVDIDKMLERKRE